MEILRQHQAPIHAIFCAIGGGGLIAGVAAYVKQVRPDIKIIGVQTTDSDAMYRSLKAKKRVHARTMSACSPTAQRSSWPAKKLSASARNMWMRSCWWIPMPCARPSRTCSRTRAPSSNRRVHSPSPAPSCTPSASKLKGETLVTVCSGANMNFDRLRFVAERAEIGEKREAILAVTIPETPGSFRKFCSLLGKRNITEFNYRYADPKAAQVFVGMQVNDQSETSKLVDKLQSNKLQHARPDRQRNGQAASAPSGRRTRAGSQGRNPVPLRSSRNVPAR